MTRFRKYAKVRSANSAISGFSVSNDDRADWREAWTLFPGDVAYVWHGALHAATVAQSFEACDFQIRSPWHESFPHQTAQPARS
jgi:hypothetical protein